MLLEGKIGVVLQLMWKPLPLGALPFTEGLPGISQVVSTSPVRRLLFDQRLMVEREIPKSSATSLLGMPRSMAASTFNLRSFE